MLLLLTTTLLSYAGRPGANHIVKFGKQKKDLLVSRNSAVRVESSASKGSGGLFLLGDMVILVSAAHVTGVTDSEGYVFQGSMDYSFSVFYSHKYTDVSFSYVKGHPKDNLTEYNPASPSSIGDSMVYSGYPDSFNKCSFRGDLVGGEVLSYNPRYVLNIYSWFGSSGSVAFDQDGRPVGVSSSIANLENRHTTELEAMQSLSFFSPLYSYAKEDVISYACKHGIESELCK